MVVKLKLSRTGPSLLQLPNYEAYWGLQSIISTSTPVLAFADFMKPFKLHTDASTIGLGTVLHQEQGGKDWVIGYDSRALSKSESNTWPTKLEF